MNKIIMDQENNYLTNTEVIIDYQCPNIILNIAGKVVINDFNNKLNTLKIIMNDQSELIYNKYNQDLKAITINMIVNNNSKVTFNQSINNSICGTYNIITDILGNNNKICENIYGATSLTGNYLITATGKVNPHVYDNELLENIHVLTLNDLENTIIPNLLVSSEKVNVYHNTAISSIDPNYLFYLNSKGISNNVAKALIIKGFLLSKLNNVNEILNINLEEVNYES
jgi:phosphotransferase system IIB component